MLIETEVLGKYDYYKKLIRDLGLEKEFREQEYVDENAEDPVEAHELEVGEGEVVSDVLEAAPDYYVLDIRERPPRYKVSYVPESELET
jgi:hypothetical protein